MGKKKEPPTFADKIGPKADRKLKAENNSSRVVWSGLGMMGMVGWSVVVPTLLGAALGLWLDGLFPPSHSWMLALLVAGLVLGCVNAGYWVAKEDRDMHNDPEDDDE